MRKNNLFLASVVAAGFLAIPVCGFAEPQAAGQEKVVQEVKNLSQKISLLEKQNQEILENQKKILEELETLKVRVHRRS